MRAPQGVHDERQNHLPEPAAHFHQSSKRSPIRRSAGLRPAATSKPANASVGTQPSGRRNAGNPIAPLTTPHSTLRIPHLKAPPLTGINRDKPALSG